MKSIVVLVQFEMQGKPVPVPYYADSLEAARFLEELMRRNRNFPGDAQVPHILNVSPPFGVQIGE